MTAKPGDRVAAVRSATDSTVYIYGRGVYAGRHPRPGSGDWSQGDREMAERVVRDDLQTDTEQLRAADDAFMVRKLDEAVAKGSRTREEANRALKEYREARAAREAKRASMTVEEQATELLREMSLNPRIDLDNGDTVWGFQCWWMPEEHFEKFAAGREVEDVEVPS